MKSARLVRHYIERLLDFIRRDMLRKKGKRRHIHPRLGVEGFFRELKNRDVRYSVLRWFESLPRVEAGEDIDLLVADEDLAKMDDLFRGSRSWGTPCDIYTSSGLPGSSFRGIAYFPEHLALDLLETAVWQNGLVRVPDAKRHCLSMIYHVLYHKGYDAGLPSELAKEHGRDLPDPASVDHDYADVLTRCASAAGLDLPPLTLEDLDGFLEKQGWQPSRDALEKLSARNLWVYDRFFADIPGMEHHWRGFSVFIVRERGVQYLDLVRTMLFDAGFEILLDRPLEGPARENAARTLRGGNWNRGPWPVSGGVPAHCIAVNDSFVLEPSDKLIAKHKGLANSRLWDTKIRIRDAVNALQPRSAQCNILHSADNPRQGLEYLQTALPDVSVEQIDRRLKEIHGSVSIPFRIVGHQNGYSRRARVSLVEYGDAQAIAKVYRPGRERFMEREILARELGRELPETVPVLEKGPSWFVMPRYRDVLNRDRLLPLGIIKRVRAVLLHYRRAGYELIDFKPKNLILDAEEGLKVIDFEFMQPTENPEETNKTGSSQSLKGNYCWYRVPLGFSGDLPVMTASRRNNYYRFWFSATALPRFCVVRDYPVPLLALIRVFFILPAWAMRTVRKNRGRIREGRRALRSRIIASGKKILGYT